MIYELSEIIRMRILTNDSDLICYLTLILFYFFIEMPAVLKLPIVWLPLPRSSLIGLSGWI